MWIGYDNLAAMKDDKSTLLHIVECAAHIKATVAHFLGKSSHLDTKSLVAMRSGTSFGEEPSELYGLFSHTSNKRRICVYEVSCQSPSSPSTLFADDKRFDVVGRK